MTKTEKELLDYNEAALEFNKLLLRQLRALRVKYEALNDVLKTTKKMLNDVILDNIFNAAENNNDNNPSAN